MKLLLVALAVLLTACTTGSTEISAELGRRFSKGESTAIDLAQLGPPSWERVCVLTPYTTNPQAEHVLGFKWNAEDKTSIASNDGVNVLVFVQGSEVVAHAEHPRSQGDLSRLNPRCLSRANAKVVRRTGDHGWVYLVAKDAA